MPVTTPPSITALPTPPDPNDRSTFNSRAYPWSVAQQTLATEVGAVATNVFGNATEAVASATAAADDALQTGLDATATAADRVQTGLDATATAADRVQTGLDAVATDADRTAVNAALASIAGGPVVSVNGATGIVTLKTINGAALTGVGDIVAGSSLLRSARTSNTALTTTDKGKLIDITSGTFSQTFDALATLGDGWFCYLRNSGTGDITLAPDGAETIDGLASYVMYSGEVRLVQCDGTALRSIVLNAFYKTFTSSGTFTKAPGYSRFDGELYAGGASGKKDSNPSVKNGGGGGACAPFSYRADELDAIEAYVIGAGGAAQTTNSTDGNPGGNSTFKTTIAYGGAGGSVAGGAGGSAYINIAVASGNTNHYIAGAASAAANPAYLGGATSSTSAGRSPTVKGGGAGGSVDASDALSQYGTTIFGGAGGAASLAGSGVDGTAPGGGGGATKTGAQSGAGARGQLDIWGVI